MMPAAGPASAINASTSRLDACAEYGLKGLATTAQDEVLGNAPQMNDKALKGRANRRLHAASQTEAAYSDFASSAK
jgi:hypothetical protein